MKARLLFVVSALLLAGACVPDPPPPGEPFEAVDQQNVPPALGSGGVTVDCQAGVFGAPDVTRRAAQTFRPQRSGDLTKVSLIALSQLGPDALRVSIQGVTNGAPNGTVLAQTAYDGAGSPDPATFIDITFPTPAAVTAGTEYALVLAVPSCTSLVPDDRWVVVAPEVFVSPYFGGSLARFDPPGIGAFWQSEDLAEGGFGADLAFKTWVTSSDPLPTAPPAGTPDATRPPVFDEQTGLTASPIDCPPSSDDQWVLSSQTFTAGRTGLLDEVGLWLGAYQPSSPREPVAVTIQTVDGSGNPTGTVLGGGIGDTTTAPPISTLPTTSAPIEIPLARPAPVVAGTTYAIVIAKGGSTCSASLVWWTTSLASPDVYAGGRYARRSWGSAWAPLTSDAFFTTSISS